jgi:uncharacterized protein
MNEILLLTAIGVVAFFYSSVGHGGASGYLALMALAGFAPVEMRPSALVLNTLVASIAFLNYQKSVHFDFHKLIPLIAGSVPAAFIGVQINTDVRLYKILLGIILLAGIIRMLITFRTKEYPIRTVSFLKAFLIGSVIGFLSGVIGIGGGILLSPVMILMRWSTIKETACLSAAFIVINSVSGLGGLMISGFTVTPVIILFLAVAVAGGLTGSYFGSRQWPVLTLKYVLAGVLLFASIKLISG